MDFTRGAQNIYPEFGQKWSEIVFDFNAFFFLLHFPVFAFPAYLLTNRIKYNFSEYVVVFIYVMAHYSIVAFPISIGTLLFNADMYVSISQPLLILIFVYCLYVLRRLTKYSARVFIGRALVYTMLAILLFFILVIGPMMVLLLIGVFDLQDFTPK